MSTSQFNQLNPSKSVITVRPLQNLEELLHEWLFLQERSLRLWKDDALWWYGERASIGGLAGAVWRSGGIVLQDYRTDKAQRDKEHAVKSEKCVGWGDMHFTLDGRKYTLEAKQCWPYLEGRPWDVFQKSEKRVLEDIDLVSTETGCTKLAVVFVTPLSKEREDGAALLSNWIGEAEKQSEWTRAWVFPELGRKLEWVWNGEKCIYPGAAIFLKAVDDAGRQN